jgi:hypothetical protein
MTVPFAILQGWRGPTTQLWRVRSANDAPAEIFIEIRLTSANPTANRLAQWLRFTMLRTRCLDLSQPAGPFGRVRGGVMRSTRDLRPLAIIRLRNPTQGFGRMSFVDSIS